MNKTVNVVSHDGYDEITTTRNAHIHVNTGGGKYKIRILDGWIDVVADGHKLVIYPYKPNEVSISRSRAKYVQPATGTVGKANE